MAAKGNAMSETTQDSGIISRPSPFAIMLRAMANDATAEENTFTGDDLTAILEAETEEEMWDADNRPPLNFQHLAGCEIAILSFVVKYSRGGNDAAIKTPFTYKDDRGNDRKMYLLVSCQRISKAGEKQIINLPPVGEVFQANTSARYIVAKLWRAMVLGLINPDNGSQLRCMVESTDLGGGEAVLKLRPVTTTPVNA